MSSDRVTTISKVLKQSCEICLTDRFAGREAFRRSDLAITKQHKINNTLQKEPSIELK